MPATYVANHALSMYNIYNKESQVAASCVGWGGIL